MLVKLLLVRGQQRALGALFWMQMAFPVGGNDTSIKLMPLPGCRLGGVARCLGTSLAVRCAFIDRHVHRLLFDDWGASVGLFGAHGGRTGLVVVCVLGVSAEVWLVGLLWVAGEGLGQSGLKALNVRLQVSLGNLAACFGRRAISTLVGPQLRAEKCIGGVVVVAIVHRGQIVVVTVYWVGCRGLASRGKASPCIVGRVRIDVVEWVCCLHTVSIH